MFRNYVLPLKPSLLKETFGVRRAGPSRDCKISVAYGGVATA
jgi:hypothetical protein